MSRNADGRNEIVTVFLHCGHMRFWRLGENPQRGAFILCTRCDTGVHVKEVVRGRAA